MDRVPAAGAVGYSSIPRLLKLKIMKIGIHSIFPAV